MTDQEYCDAPGLSNSGMRDLTTSPYRFWYLHINPNAPLSLPTQEMIFGSALHCAVLELDKFDRRYACEVNIADYPGCLVTMDDLRSFAKENGFAPKGTRKAEVIAQVQSQFPLVPILDVITQRHAEAHAGKTMLDLEDWNRLLRCSKALLEEPRIQSILADGKAELPMFVRDEEFGVNLKGKLDWVAPKLTLDIKTFSVKARGKSIDQTVADAVFYEGYHRQAYLYHVLRGWPKWNGDYVIAFIESEEPHEVRLKSIRSHVGGNVNLLWESARIEVRRLIRIYAEYSAHFGSDPWKYAQQIDHLADEEIRALAFA